MQETPNVIHPIRAETDLVLHGNIFDKAPNQAKLLDYLANCSIKGEIPKELSIGIDVFGKPQTFDPASDSFVRVHVHNLRKKLDQHYSSSDKPNSKRLAIPKGSYEVILKEQSRVNMAERSKGSQSLKSRPIQVMLAFLCTALLVSTGFNVWLLKYEPHQSNVTQELESVWQSFANNGKPTLIIVSDLYLYQTQDSYTRDNLFVRNPTINTDSDLRRTYRMHPDFGSKIRTAHNRFLLQSTVDTLPRIISALRNVQANFEVQTLSNVEPHHVRDMNFIYIGMFKSMGVLKNYFDSSRFMCRDNCKQLAGRDSGEVYNSIGPRSQNHIDYGLVARFTRSNGSMGIILGGFTDAGIKQATRSITDIHEASNLRKTLENMDLSMNGSFEVLYEVNGFNYADYNAAVKESGAIEMNTSWKNNPEE